MENTDILIKQEDGDSDTLLTLTHSRLTKSNQQVSRFAPGWHAYLDRLEAILNNHTTRFHASVRRGQRIISMIVCSITTTNKLEGSN